MENNSIYRKYLNSVGYPLNPNATNEEIIHLVFKPSIQREKLLRWIACELKRVEHSQSSGLTGNDLLQIFTQHVYIPKHCQEGFVNGTCVKDTQRKIWKAVFSELKMIKSHRNINISVDTITCLLKDVCFSEHLVVPDTWYETFVGHETISSPEIEPTGPTTEELVNQFERIATSSLSSLPNVTPLPDTSKFSYVLNKLESKCDAVVKANQEKQNEELFSLEENETLLQAFDSFKSFNKLFKDGKDILKNYSLISELNSKLNIVKVE